jgi:aspartyl-tRNA(Asn)/glutamyl-tRNA(Gln) amidotransferase subunit A
MSFPTISETSEQIRAGVRSPVAVVRECLQKIDALQPKLNAFITILADQALATARDAEREVKAGRWLGPLHGIPIGIKDFYDTAGVRTTAAFKPFADRVPKKDAVAVAQLKRAGAIIIGKTNMHELGQGTTSLVSAFGPVKNPVNTDYIAGGSSGGSAVAVATGMCFATLDTDAIGSCRLPAACCGVVGFKGSYDRISTHGILAGEQADPAIIALSHAAITTRSAQDTLLILQSAFPRSGTESGSQGEARIGVVTNFKAAKPVLAVFAELVSRRFGDNVRKVEAPFDNPGFDIRTIESDRRTIAGKLFKDVDLLILPTTTQTTLTIRLGDGNPQALSPENTMFANYYGLPAISVPMGHDPNGLPLGFQIVGRPGDELTVLEFASN